MPSGLNSGGAVRVTWVAIGIAMTACTSTESAPVSGSPAPVASATSGASAEAPSDTASIREPDGGTLAQTSGSSFPPPWCDRAGPESTRIDVVNDIANYYFVESNSDCRTAGLIASLTTLQQMLWLGYLVDFTYLLTGCPLDAFDEALVPGALSVFGIANTPAVGASRPLLGPDDVDLLITMYVGHFGDALMLSAEERTIVSEFLADTARDAIDPTVARTLSMCPDDASAAP